MLNMYMIKKNCAGKPNIIYKQYVVAHENIILGKEINKRREKEENRNKGNIESNNEFTPHKH